ncbi:MAG: CopG family transcriptional regulator [Planctomycetota bacterium]|nr:MAG: CopG family transcriptional regulator [Planctomycetota bacterium]
MPRLTITLSDEQHRALKEAAVRRGVPMRQIIEESLALAGIKTRKTAAEIVAKARKKAAMQEADALELAVRETRAARKR